MDLVYEKRSWPEEFDDYVLRPVVPERDALVRFFQLRPASLAKAFEYTKQREDLPSDINVVACAAANRAIARHNFEAFKGRYIPDITCEDAYTVIKSISIEESAVIYEGTLIPTSDVKYRSSRISPTEVIALPRQRGTLCCSSNPGPDYPSMTFVPDDICWHIAQRVAYPLPCHWVHEDLVSFDFAQDILQATCANEHGYRFKDEGGCSDEADSDDYEECDRVTVLKQAAFLLRIERGDEPEASQYAKNYFAVNKSRLVNGMPTLYEPLAGAQTGDATHFAPVFAAAPAIAQFYKRVSAMEGGVNEANCRTLINQIETATAMPELDGKCYVFCAIRSKTDCGWIDPRWSLEKCEDVEFVLNTLDALQEETEHARAVREQVDSIARISMVQEPITLDQPVRVIEKKPRRHPLDKDAGKSSPSFLRVDIPRQVRSHPLHAYTRAIIVDPGAMRDIHAAAASPHANAVLGSFSGDDYRFTQIRRAMEPLVRDFLAKETKKRDRDDMEKKAEGKDKVNGGPRPAKNRKFSDDFS